MSSSSRYPEFCSLSHQKRVVGMSDRCWFVTAGAETEEPKSQLVDIVQSCSAGLRREQEQSGGDINAPLLILWSGQKNTDRDPATSVRADSTFSLEAYSE